MIKKLMALAVVSTASVNAFVGSGISRMPRLNNCNANVAMCSNRKQDEGSLFPNKKKDNGILNQNVTAGSFHNQKIIENSSNVIQTIRNIRTRQSNTGPLKASNIEPDRTGGGPSEKQGRQERLDKIKSSLLNKDQESKKNGCCPSEKDKREKRMDLAKKNGFYKAMVVSMQKHLLNEEWYQHK